MTSAMDLYVYHLILYVYHLILFHILEKAIVSLIYTERF